jgi:hypothetical protein
MCSLFQSNTLDFFWKDYKKYFKIQWGQSMFQPRFEPSFSKIQGTSYIAWDKLKEKETKDFHKAQNMNL